MTNSGQARMKSLRRRSDLMKSSDTTKWSYTSNSDCPDRQVALQPGRGGGQHQLGLDVELGCELELPLLGQMGRAQHRQLAGVATLQQLPGDEGGLDGLAPPPRRRRSGGGPGRDAGAISSGTNW